MKYPNTASLITAIENTITTNNQRAVTAAIVKQRMIDIVETVSQVSFDSSSFATSASLAAVAGRVTNLEAFSSSLATTYVTETTFNGFTSSYNTGSWLGTASTSSYSAYALTASYAFSASVEITKEVSSSYADVAQIANTASYVNIKGSGIIVTRFGAQTQLTASVDLSAYAKSVNVSGTFATKAQLNVSSSTIDQRINQLTGSSLALTNEFNAFTSSVLLSASFNAYTSSVATKTQLNVSSSALKTYTLAQTASLSASLNTRINKESSSFSTFSTNVYAVNSASFSASISNLNKFAASAKTGSFTGSFKGLLIGTASFYVERDTLQSTTTRNNRTSASIFITGSLANGQQVRVPGAFSHAEGFRTTAVGTYSHAQGSGSVAIGLGSHAEGQQNTAVLAYSHAEGIATTAHGIASHTEGQQTIAIGQWSHAEGQQTTTIGTHAHTEGYLTVATTYAHAEGRATSALQLQAHSEGENTTAKNRASHAEGFNTIAAKDYQHAEGQFNREDVNAIWVVGDGISNAARKNLVAAYTNKLTITGSTQISGSIIVRGAITASLARGFVLVGGANNRTVLVATSSFAGSGGGGGGFNSVSQSASFPYTTTFKSGSATVAAYNPKGAATASYVNIKGSGITVNYNGAQIQLTGSTVDLSLYAKSAAVSASLNASSSRLRAGVTSSLLPYAKSVAVSGTFAKSTSVTASLNALSVSLKAGVTSSLTPYAKSINVSASLNASSSALKTYTLQQTASLRSNLTASIAYVRAKSVVTASAVGSTITFTKGDASTFAVTLLGGGGGGSGANGINILGNVLQLLTGSTVMDSVQLYPASSSRTAQTASYVTWTNVANKPNRLLSGSAQIATNISGAFAATSASLASRATATTVFLSTPTSVFAGTASFVRTASFYVEKDTLDNVVARGNTVNNRVVTINGGLTMKLDTGTQYGVNIATQFGGNNTVSNASFAHGHNNTANNNSVAFGLGARATGLKSFAEGQDTLASADGAHAEGQETTAKHSFSSTAGRNTESGKAWQFVVGEYNRVNANAQFVVGGGTGVGSKANILEATIGRVSVTGSLGVSGAVTASLARGFVLVGGLNNRTTLVATSSFAGGSSATPNLQSVLTTGRTASGSFALGTSAAPTQNASALFQLESTTQGALFPRMTNAQRTSIASPAAGLIVYCTNAPEGLFIYKATGGWIQII